MSGYRVFNRRFVKSYPILVEGFQIETDMTLHALHQRFRIVEVSVEYKDRPAGSVSKLQMVPDGARSFRHSADPALLPTALFLRHTHNLVRIGERVDRHAGVR
jgi:hypothetical protein